MDPATKKKKMITCVIGGLSTYLFTSNMLNITGIRGKKIQKLLWTMPEK